MINKLHKSKEKKEKILPKSKRTKKSSSRFPQIFEKNKKHASLLFYTRRTRKNRAEREAREERKKRGGGFIRKTNRFPEMEGGGRDDRWLI